MLRAYDYTESRADSMFVRDVKLFNKEKEIAQKFVLNNPLTKKICECPACECNNTKYIFESWGIDYYICQECNSIFVPAEEELISSYLELEEMKEFRNTEIYQKQASTSRAEQWKELLFWIQYRVYRYIKKSSNLMVIDIGNKYKGLIDKLTSSSFIANYEWKDAICEIDSDKICSADVILYINHLQHEINPVESLQRIKKFLSDDGLLILSTRLGSGFDILTLKGGTDDIFPYEHVMLPSRKGLELILNRAGYEMLEISTPGIRDIDSVMKNRERVEESNFFIKYFLSTADDKVLQDFQQFLQKSGFSSFARVIARKRR